MMKVRSLGGLLLPLLVRASSSMGPHVGFVNSEMETVGCFARDPLDAEDAFVYMDNTCLTKGKNRCRSGLPFYRLTLHEDQSFLDCQTFCLSKGMDLVGLVAPEMECRCGASRRNTALWQHKMPREDLLLSLDSKLIGDANCSILVWQYVGELNHGAVPAPLKRMSAKDHSYIGSIVEGKDVMSRFIEKPQGDDELPIRVSKTNLSHPNLGRLCKDQDVTGYVQPNGQGMSCSQLKGFCKKPGYMNSLSSICPVTCGSCSQPGLLPCYPHNCANGGGPWLTKGTDGVAVINYFFDSDIDQARRVAFESAVQWWQSRTCVRFQESTATPRIKVEISDIKSCEAEIGYPGPGGTGTSSLNLGFCNSMAHVGSIAHEIGHALGMNHEHQRPDGPQRYNIPGVGWKGPYINVHMENIDRAWRPQYQPSDVNYIGSAARGYAAYDYESIMHYPEGNADGCKGLCFNTVNPIYDKVVGQRDHLSAGDILRANDMYQCSGSAPSPTPGPTPGSSCQDVESQSNCESWKGLGYCLPSSGDHYPYSQYYCRKTCNFCYLSPVPMPTAEIESQVIV